MRSNKVSSVQEEKKKPFRKLENTLMILGFAIGFGAVLTGDFQYFAYMLIFHGVAYFFVGIRSWKSGRKASATLNLITSAVAIAAGLYYIL